MTKRKEENLERDQGEDLQRGKVIANIAEIQVVLRELSRVFKSDFFNDQDIVTKKQGGVVTAKLEECFKLYKNVRASADSIAGLFRGIHSLNEPTGGRGSDITTNNRTFFCVSALVLLMDKKLTIADAVETIEKKTSWRIFQSHFIDQSHLFYYWRQNSVQFASMELKCLVNRVEGRIIYYDHAGGGPYLKNKNQFIIKEYREVKKMIYVTADDQDDLRTQLVIRSAKHENDVQFCAYSVSTSSSLPAAGVGILVRVKDIEEEINLINSEGKVKDGIYNFLYQRREELEKTDSVPLASEGFFCDLQSLAGIWKCYYLRNDLPEDLRISEKGGLETNYLKVYRNGKIEMRGRGEKERYEGFMSFQNKHLIKGSLSIQQNKIYQLHLFLNVVKEGNEKFLEGVLSGWTSPGKLPFSCLIRMEQLKDLEEIDSAKLDFIRKDEITGFKFVQGHLDFLRNGKKYLNVAAECLPDLPDTSHRSKLSKLEGNFFLVSYDRDLWSLLKLPLVITNLGMFEITFPKFKLLGSTNYFEAADNNGYLVLKIKERVDEEKKKPFIGEYIFYLGGLLNGPKNDKVYSKISILPGISLRINSVLRPQAKKEYIIPAADGKTLNCHSEKPDPFRFTYLDPSFFENLKFPTNHDSKDSRFLKELAKSLKGRDGNSLQIRKDDLNNGSTNRLRETDYKLIYYRAFLFELLFKPSQGQANKETNDYLLLALQHGLGKDMALDELKLVVDKTQVPAEKFNEIFEKLITANQAIVERYQAAGNLKILQEIFRRPVMIADPQLQRILEELMATIRSIFSSDGPTKKR